MSVVESVKGHRDFRRLWIGRIISQFGSDIGAVGLPIVAVSIVDASTFQVALLSAVTAVTTALVAFPIGAQVEFRPKRPVLIGTDLTRCAFLASIPVAGLLGVLTFPQLCVVAAVNAVCQLAFAAASQAHVKALVSDAHLLDANGRLQSTTWLSLTVGRSLGGVAVAVFTALGAIAVDALSFVAGALAVRRIRQPEPPAPSRTDAGSRWAEMLGGLRFVWTDRVLRRMLCGWVGFAGLSGMVFPVTTVFYLRDLGFTSWQYGLLMGIPSLGGFVGARLARRVVAKGGAIPGLWWASLARGPWFFLIPLAPKGTIGLLMCGFGFGVMLFFASLANSIMAGHRQLRTPDELQTRVATLWTFATTVSQPVFILCGGGLAAWLGTRETLLGAAVAITAVAFLLPRRESGDRPAGGS